MADWSVSIISNWNMDMAKALWIFPNETNISKTVEINQLTHSCRPTRLNSILCLNLGYRVKAISDKQ